jgi:tetratricopeptide (TPR) repeat protein
VAEYALLRRRLGTVDPQEARVRALHATNGAELLMGMGPDQLEEAIRWYDEGLTLAPEEVLGYYGAAVANDRAGNPGRALELMREGLAREGALSGDSPCRMERITDSHVFFVPEGDVEYYLGLGCEAGGDHVRARAHYNRFITMLPDSPYLGRARARLAGLSQKSGLVQPDALPAPTSPRRKPFGAAP